MQVGQLQAALGHLPLQPLLLLAQLMAVRWRHHSLLKRFNLAGSASDAVGPHAAVLAEAGECEAQKATGKQMRAACVMTATF